MPTPFPGMDPYLEHHTLWPNVHSRLVIALADDLAPRLRPRYCVAVEERTILSGPGDLTFALRPDAVVIEPKQLNEGVAVYEAAWTAGLLGTSHPLPCEWHLHQTEYPQPAMTSPSATVTITCHNRGAERDEPWCRCREHDTQ